MSVLYMENNQVALYKRIAMIFKDKDSFTLGELYESLPGEKHETLRARIYEKLGKIFLRVAKGVYKVIEGIYCALKGDNHCITIHGDGRDMWLLKDESVDAIVTDHPWLDLKANKGGNRDMAKGFDCFEYTQEDFNEMARVLKSNGNFMVQIIPAENASNYKYLHSIKLMAEKAGFTYYCKVPWIKKGFVSNTGRKAKNSEDILLFTKGVARKLRKDVKKSKKTGILQYMSGTNKMLPTAFEIEPVGVKDRIHPSEKPVELLEAIIEHITLENEIILDNMAGSGSLGEAALNKGRSAILIEILKEHVDKIIDRLGAVPIADMLNI